MTKSMDPFRFLLSRARTEDQLEGVPDATLGPDRDRSDKPFRVGIQIWTARWKLHRYRRIQGAMSTSGLWMAHYHCERNHQGLANALICPEPEHSACKGEVQRRERLGGLLNYYYRKAA